MNASLTDRIISILSYYTFGIFSLIWIVFANVTKRRITPYLMFNLYQAIFVSVLLAVISLLYSIAINFISVIPFIGKLAVWFDTFFNTNPLFFSFTLSGLLTTLLVLYLSLPCLIGKRPYIPFVSDIIKTNFGG